MLRCRLNEKLRPISVCLLVLGSLLALLNFVWQVAVYYFNGFAKPCPSYNASFLVQHGHGALWFLLQLLALPVAVWLTYIAATPHLRLTALFAVVNWYSQVTTWSVNLVDCDLALLPVSAEASELFSEAILAFGTLPSALTSFVLCFYLVWKRMDAMEASALESFSAVLLRRLLLYVELPLFFLLFATVVPFRAAHALPALLSYTATGVWIFINCLVFREFLRAYQSVVRAKSVPGEEERTRRARQAAKSLLKQNVGAMLALFSAFVRVAWNFVTAGFWPFNVVGAAEAIGEEGVHGLQRFVQAFDLVANLYFALALSGVITGAAKGTRRRAEVHRERKRRWQAVSSAWKQRQEQGTEEEVEWRERVKALSGRGLSLKELLRFYRSLGKERMAHFDPERNTTADVVYQAIIPMTADAMVSGSEVLMEGKHTEPRKMVTHNWGNLFRDLVASIVADALGESDFSMVSEMLTRNVAVLEQWVAQRKMDSCVYWVCAFAVNQHLGICNKSRRNDSVTGLPHPVCKCKLPKALNDTAPTLPDGRGIKCEMNKFDDMMRYLSAKNPLFEQVVAIDGSFEIFSRAWCIAEVAAANDMGMPQKLKVVSADRLTQNMERLKGLRIQDMEASRAEDKEQILESISDHEHFNATLQRLLFEDLIPSWKTMDGEEQMDLAGQIIRWQRALSLTF